MVTEAKKLQKKEFLLQRTNIRTMRKDIKRLRETDVVRESEKIIKMKTTEKIPELADIKSESLLQNDLAKKNVFGLSEKPSYASPSLDTPNEQSEVLENKEKQSLNAPRDKQQEEEEQKKKQSFSEAPDKLGKILQTNIEQESNQSKKYANETEKQQIFLLESQRLDLEKQIQFIGNREKPPLLLEKNKKIMEQKNWKEKLNPLIEEEGKVEMKLKIMGDKEHESNMSAEKQNLEKERWQVEDQKQKIEKKKWPIEQEFVKLEDRIKNLDANYEELTAKENELKTKITEINNSLREIYSNIAGRERKIKAESVKVSLKKVQIDSEEKNRLQSQQQTTPSETKEREYLKGVPLAAKEKLAQSTQIEGEQRKKFMEDVEEWASSFAKTSVNEEIK